MRPRAEPPAGSILRGQAVEDGVFDHAVDAFGLAGVAELIGILGHDSLLAMLLKAFEVPAPGEAAIPLESEPK